MDFELLKVSFSPTKKQVKEIKAWLIEEYNSTKDGFYCHWEEIISDFEIDKMSIILYNDEVVGFATWYCIGFRGTLNIVEIKDTYRNKRIGKFLIQKLLNYLLAKGIYVVDLQSDLPSIIDIWKKLGFVDYPDVIQMAHKRFYKILIPYLETTQVIEGADSLELWNNEPGLNRGIDATWKWNLQFKEGTRELVLPIIQPCKNDWQIQWTADRLILYNEKLKRFCNDKFYQNSFIYIDKLPDL